MKKKIEITNPLEIETKLCEDCLKEFLKEELHKCHDCNMLLCKVCLEIHEEDHLADHYAEEEEEEEEYGKRPSKKNWD